MMVEWHGIRAICKATALHFETECSYQVTKEKYKLGLNDDDDYDDDCETRT